MRIAKEIKAVSDDRACCAMLLCAAPCCSMLLHAAPCVFLTFTAPLFDIMLTAETKLLGVPAAAVPYSWR